MLALVGYEMIIATRRYAPRWLSIISYPTRLRGVIIVNYSYIKNECNRTERYILITNNFSVFLFAATKDGGLYV